MSFTVIIKEMQLAPAPNVGGGLQLKKILNERVIDWTVKDLHKSLPRGNDLEVVSFTANGHELNFIKEKFQNLPVCDVVCTWRGELAQFIYDNL